jgi:hypothetical protein
MKTVQVKRIKKLEKENSHLKKAVAELTLEKLLLKEALEGKASYFRAAGLSGDQSTPVNPETQLSWQG